jgi:hypothetical protein
MSNLCSSLISRGLSVVLPAVMLGAAASTGSVPHVYAACAWSVVASPNAPGDNFLRGVAATSASDVWAVGDFKGGIRQQTLIEHWGGTSLENRGEPQSRHRRQSFAGGGGNIDHQRLGGGVVFERGTGRTLIEHWDAKSWKVVSSPNVGTGDLLFGAAAVSAANIWAVGYYAATAHSPLATLVEHWDATSWKKVVSSPNVGTSNNYLYGVAASSASNVLSNAAWKAGSTAVIHQTAAASGALKARDVSITLKATANSVAIRNFRPASVAATTTTLAQTGGGVPALPIGLGLVGLVLVVIGAGIVTRRSGVSAQR